jgi:hypothetical protein
MALSLFRSEVWSSEELIVIREKSKQLARTGLTEALVVAVSLAEFPEYSRLIMLGH